MVGFNGRSKEKKENRTLENSSGRHEETTDKDTCVAIGGVLSWVVMVTITQPCDNHSMNRKKDESRANQKCSFPNLLDQDQDQTSKGKNWLLISKAIISSS